MVMKSKSRNKNIDGVVFWIALAAGLAAFVVALVCVAGALL
jgi:hypothetical protein